MLAAGSPSRSLTDVLGEQASVWSRRPLLRRLYGEWFDLIADRLADPPGTSLELGSGFAPLKRRLPDLVATDVEPTPWAELVVDAHALPFADGALANVVTVDVLHHLSDLPRLFDELCRTLRPGGRLVAVEPYASTLSTVAYRRFHHERTDRTVDPFHPDPAVAAGAMAGNQALPTLVFFDRAAEFHERWPELRIVERRRFAFLLYPLSGGFSRRQLVPAVLYRPLRVLEAALQPAAPLLAFRCLVVVERLAGPAVQGSSGQQTSRRAKKPHRSRNEPFTPLS